MPEDSQAEGSIERLKWNIEQDSLDVEEGPFVETEADQSVETESAGKQRASEQEIWHLAQALEALNRRVERLEQKAHWEGE